MSVSIWHGYASKRMVKRCMRTTAGKNGKFGCREKKKRGERQKDWQRKAWVEKLLDSEEGGAAMLHNITKPSPWRGGAHVNDVFGDAEPLKRADEKRQEWKDPLAGPILLSKC